MNNIKISDNYYISDFTRSQTATRLSITEQFEPSDEIVNNLKLVATKIVEPIRKVLGSNLILSSGYRCIRLNKAVKGVKNSQHLTGQAVDLEYIENGIKDNQKIIDTVEALKLDYDQMLLEYPVKGVASWIHLSYNSNGNRKEKIIIK